MKPFKSFEINRSEWDAGNKWAVRIPREENYIHEYDDFRFFWTRQEAREWITWYKTRKNNDKWIDLSCFPRG
jgi:hypothetical protein